LLEVRPWMPALDILHTLHVRKVLIVTRIYGSGLHYTAVIPEPVSFSFSPTTDTYTECDICRQTTLVYLILKVGYIQ